MLDGVDETGILSDELGLSSLEILPLLKTRLFLQDDGHLVFTVTSMRL